MSGKTAAQFRTVLGVHWPDVEAGHLAVGTYLAARGLRLLRSRLELRSEMSISYLEPGVRAAGGHHHSHVPAALGALSNNCRSWPLVRPPRHRCEPRAGRKLQAMVHSQEPEPMSQGSASGWIMLR